MKLFRFPLSASLSEVTLPSGWVQWKMNAAHCKLELREKRAGFGLGVLNGDVFFWFRSISFANYTRAIARIEETGPPDHDSSAVAPFARFPRSSPRRGLRLGLDPNAVRSPFGRKAMLGVLRMSLSFLEKNLSNSSVSFKATPQLNFRVPDH